VNSAFGGVDTILDNMGASYLERNIAALKRNGRMVIIGMQGGITAEFNIAQALRKNVTISATSLRARPDNEKSAICREVEKVVWPWITNGTVKQVIDRVMPIQQAPAAQQMIENGEVTGKIILQVR
jgi:NADPH:quinone reductase-like Zn-dependent oxidoreductase